VNDIISALTAVLPPKRKSTPSGWTSFDAPCCHNRGESRDTKKRGGILIGSTDNFQYHCFNCGFKAGWTPGKLLSQNTKNLFRWLGLNQDDVNRLNLYALKLKDNEPVQKKTLSFDLHNKPLPDNSIDLKTLIQADTDNYIHILDHVTYLTKRNFDIDWYPWHISTAPGYTDRIIIPFYYQGRCVGYTARKITEGKPKYLADSQPSYVFNLDRQTDQRRYVIVVEGPFDAIGIDGVAVLTNEINSAQATRIQSLNREVIIVPDRDRAGAKLLSAALEYGWSVSVPPWEEDIKDCADAVTKYGRLYTLSTILHYRETNRVKIEILRKKLQHATT